MLETGIRFPLLNGGQEQSYTSNDIENFKGEELFDNLAREIIQNSLDAPNPDSEEPVKVVFQMKYLKKNEICACNGRFPRTGKSGQPEVGRYELACYHQLPKQFGSC